MIGKTIPTHLIVGFRDNINSSYNQPKIKCNVALRYDKSSFISDRNA